MERSLRRSAPSLALLCCAALPALAQDAFSLRYEAERYPAIKMVAIKEYHVAKAA